MRRITLALILAAATAAQQPTTQVQTKPGTERWPVKTSVPAKSGKAQTVALADLLALPDAAGVSKNDKRYQSARIPAQSGQKLPEGTVVTTTGWLHLVALETDGDYHIQISASPTSGDQCLIVEVPDPDPAYTASTNLRPQFETVRNTIKTKMLAGKDPSGSGSVMQHPVYVTVTGILFYDDSHVGDPPRGKKGMHAATLWELHPVTGLTFPPKPQSSAPASNQ
jgi:hypothetical protein